jgi:hypothetical protein
MNHIEIHMHYIWDLVHEGIIDLQFFPSTEQTAYIFTRPSLRRSSILYVVILE